MQKKKKKKSWQLTPHSPVTHTLSNFYFPVKTSNYKQAGSEDLNFIQSGTNTEAQLPHTFGKRKKYMLKRKHLQPRKQQSWNFDSAAK